MNFSLSLCFLVVAMQTAIVWSLDIKVLEHHPSNFNMHSNKMLRHALSYSGDKYSVSLFPVESDLAREMQLLENGTLRVVWTTTSAEAEKKFIPIRVPIFGGLMANRVLLIRPEMQKAFGRVEQLEDLKKFTFGQGEHWSDTKVLEENNFKVVKSAIYFRLFDMLHHGRFDAFPRGLTEPWMELKANADLDLAVEKTLIISYKMPVYFFVRKDDEALANDIEYGMNMAVDDGSLKQFLLDDASLVAGLLKLDLKNRKIFKIDNPFLSEKTPLSVRKYWIDARELLESLVLDQGSHDKLPSAPQAATPAKSIRPVACD